MNKHYPVPKGLHLLPYQVEAIDFALTHENWLIADEMGLGNPVNTIVQKQKVITATLDSSSRKAAV